MKPKQVLFTLALFLSVAFMKAQDKYEFMIIEYNTFNGKELSTSIDGIKFNIEKIELPKEERSTLNANPFLKKVKEYQDQNWEVISFNSTFNGNQLAGNFYEAHFAHLRKKIK